MKKGFVVVMLGCAVLFGCSRENPKNEVDFQQINVDESNDYRFIFRENIEKENQLKKKYHKSPFE